MIDDDYGLPLEWHLTLMRQLKETTMHDSKFKNVDVADMICGDCQVQDDVTSDTDNVASDNSIAILPTSKARLTSMFASAGTTLGKAVGAVGHAAVTVTSSVQKTVKKVIDPHAEYYATLPEGIRDVIRLLKKHKFDIVTEQCFAHEGDIGSRVAVKAPTNKLVAEAQRMQELLRKQGIMLYSTQLEYKPSMNITLDITEEHGHIDLYDVFDSMLLKGK